MRMTIIDPRSIGCFKPARWGVPEGSSIACGLCPHRCVISEGGLGRCRARGVLDGKLMAFNYGRICAQIVDQIEKKPIYHYQPGSKLLSIGTFGCNLDCDCCQNAALAMSGPKGRTEPVSSPEEVVSFAVQKGVHGIAFTFNEPVVWSEFVVDLASLAKERGLYLMMNTNGYIEEEPLKELLEAVDVFKVDVKGFTDDFYRKSCGGTLSPVLRTCRMIKEQGRHLELAYLIIPGLNDSQEEMGLFFRWAAELGKDVPVHLYRFMPAHRLSHIQPTGMEAMRDAKALAASHGLRFVYLSGMVEGDEHQTFCPKCGALVISRAAKEVSEKVVYEGNRLSKFCPSYSEIEDRTIEGRCSSCSEIIYKGP
ncbi:MAG: AmmeMemoRadiSam system radical SAM enzyme [Methanomassiliicoccales archaeon]